MIEMFFFYISRNHYGEVCTFTRSSLKYSTPILTSLTKIKKSIVQEIVDNWKVVISKADGRCIIINFSWSVHTS